MASSKITASAPVHLAQFASPNFVVAECIGPLSHPLFANAPATFAFVAVSVRFIERAVTEM